MAQPLINIGAAANDGTGDPLRTAFQKVNRLPNPDNTVNPLSGDYSGTYEQKITAAIADGVATGKKYCWITQPYTASLVTFNSALRMLVEGYDPSNWNVRAYGATGNGVADDAAAIQAAINAIPTTGGTVYSPPGLPYMVGSTITLPTDRLVILRGDGEDAQSGGLITSGSVWKRLSGQSGAMVSQNGGGTVSNHGPQMFHMIFDGGNQSNDLVTLAQTQGFRIAYCTFFNSNGNGLLVTGAAYNFYLDFCRFFELGNTTAFPNGTSALVLNSNATGGVVDGWITQPHFESGRGSYITCNDTSGTHPVDGVSILGGKLEWSGNNATGFAPPAASAIAMPFMLLSNATNWMVYATFFSNGFHANATHIRTQNCQLDRFYTNHETTSGLADNQLPTFFIDLFSGPTPSGMYISGIFTRGAQAGTAGAHIRVVESSMHGYQIDPGSQFVSPASGVGIKFTNPTTGASSFFPVSGGIGDKLFALTSGVAPAVNAQDGNFQTISILTNIAVVIAAPTNPPATGQSQNIEFEITNSSGGALTTPPTFAAGVGAFLLTAAAVNPANGQSVYYSFRWSAQRGRFMETGRTIAF